MTKTNEKITIKVTERPEIVSTRGDTMPNEEGGSSPIPYPAEDVYSAAATDNDGKEYTVYWDIVEGYPFNGNYDESEACDWEHPFLVTVSEFAQSNKNVTAKIMKVEME